MNDIILAIQKLLEHYSKILYIDLDIHHGNAVEEAFSYSKRWIEQSLLFCFGCSLLLNRVLTLSFHLYEPGFFPGSGALEAEERKVYGKLQIFVYGFSNFFFFQNKQLMFH